MRMSHVAHMSVTDTCLRAWLICDFTYSYETCAYVHRAYVHDSCVTWLIHASCHSHGWVMSHTWMSHAIRLSCALEPCHETNISGHAYMTHAHDVCVRFETRLFSTLLIHMHETRRICSFHNTTQGHKTDVAQIRPMHESTWLMSISWHTNPTHEPCHFAYVHFETREDVTHKTDMCPCRVHSVSCVTKTLCVCHENVACPFCVSRTRCVSVSCVTKTWHTKRHISSSWHISWHITRATWHTQRTQESCHFGMTDSHMWQNSFVCDMSRTKVTNEWVMSRVNESCHIWMRHATYMTRSNVTWLIHMLHDSFIRGMSHS